MKFWHYAAAFSALALGGCSGSSVKDTLGLTREAPDEYRVVSRPPLSVPPQFSLQPPSATGTAPGQMAASKQAESLVMGSSATGSLNTDTSVTPVTSSNAAKPAKADKQTASIGAADSQFLQNAGATHADPHVREVLTEERYSRMEAKEATPWWDVFGMTDDKKDPMVDAKKEADRIQQNADAGKAVTEGDTPEIKSRDTGFLGKIFDY